MKKVSSFNDYPNNRGKSWKIIRNSKRESKWNNHSKRNNCEGKEWISDKILIRNQQNEGRESRSERIIEGNLE